MSRSFPAEIVSSVPVRGPVHLVTLRSLGSMTAPEPGQFYMLQPSPSFDPLLKRPFCIFEQEDDRLSFLIRVRGEGTRLITALAKGSAIEVLGPLGTPYPMTAGRPLVTVGGMGIASVYQLIKRMAGNVAVLYGAKTKDELLYLDRIRSFSPRVHLATDDGSAGARGTVGDHLPGLLGDGGATVVYACGPVRMLERVAAVCADQGTACYVSLEENMACGIGSCLGCVVRTRGGYARVCKEGPVFDARDIVWGAGA